MNRSGFDDRNSGDHTSIPSPLPEASHRRRSSYASVAATRLRSAGRPAVAVSFPLDPPTTSSDSPSLPHSSVDDDTMHRGHFYSSARDYDRTILNVEQQPQDIEDAVAPTVSESLWPKSDILAWHSRAYNMLMSQTGSTLPTDENPEGGNSSLQTRLLSPSYLHGTVYMGQLEEKHRRWLRSVIEGRHSGHPNGSSSVASKGSGISLGLNSGHPPPAHRGMTLEVVEKPTRFTSSLELDSADDDEVAAVSPLPSRWSNDDKHGALDVVQDGYNVKYVGPKNSSEKDHEACAVRADHHIPPQCGVYYFEVTIVARKHADTTFAVGVSGKTVSLNRPPGWEPESWGYHGDDGHLFSSQPNPGRAYGPKYSPGDTIGCLVNFRTGTINFTKNGDDLGIAFRDQSLKQEKKYFPTVGLKKPGDHVWTNFGQLPFQFDIDGYVQTERDKVWEKIRQADTSKLVPGLQEPELIQQLVLEHLQHDGYVETAQAFAEEIVEEKKRLRLDPDEPVASISVRDDEDARKRQQIRRAILEGNIDLALKCTNLYYPTVLQSNNDVYFRLRCRKFIEMIRQDAEENLQREKAAASSSALATKVGGSSNYQPHFNLSTDMEVDETGAHSGNGDKDLKTEDDSMEEDDDDDPDNEGKTPPPVGHLLQELLAYGQELRAEFDDYQASSTASTNDHSRSAMSLQLDDIFALIAYENPLKVEGVKHLLDRNGRMAVAEELNSAILRSLGKSSRSALENMYGQTAVLMEVLREGGGEGVLVSIDEIISRIREPDFDTLQYH